MVTLLIGLFVLLVSIVFISLIVVIVGFIGNKLFPDTVYIWKTDSFWDKVCDHFINGMLIIIILCIIGIIIYSCFLLGDLILN